MAGMSRKTLKFMNVITNLLVLAGGLATVGVGCCWIAKIKFVVDLFERNNSFLAGLLMAAGGCATVVAIMGFYGTSKQASGTLVGYVLLSIILLIGDIAAIVLVYIKISWFDKHLRDNAKPKTFQMYFSAVVGGIGGLELIAIIFACLLITKINNIKKRQEEIEES